MSFALVFAALMLLNLAGLISQGFSYWLTGESAGTIQIWVYIGLFAVSLVLGFAGVLHAYDAGLSDGRALSEKPLDPSL